MKIQKAFRNFKVQRTIEIQMATQDEKLTQEDAERFVDGNYIPGGRFDGKYQDFCLCRTEMRYRPLRKREELDHFVDDLIIYPKAIGVDLTDRKDYDQYEMEICFDFFDGIAVECEADGSRISSNSLILLYPTIEICETIPELKRQVENYVGEAALDGINFRDIALAFGKVHRQDTFHYYGDK